MEVNQGQLKVYLWDEAKSQTERGCRIPARIISRCHCLILLIVRSNASFRQAFSDLRSWTCFSRRRLVSIPCSDTRRTASSKSVILFCKITRSEGSISSDPRPGFFEMRIPLSSDRQNLAAVDDVCFWVSLATSFDDIGRSHTLNWLGACQVLSASHFFSISEIILISDSNLRPWQSGFRLGDVINERLEVGFGSLDAQIIGEASVLSPSASLQDQIGTSKGGWSHISWIF